MVPHPIDELIEDHLFQQNAIIWLAQPSASPDGMVPLLFRQGYSALAIGRLLALPADLRQALTNVHLDTQQRAKPDVILINKGDRKYLFVDCKEGSFGPLSTTARQARTLMLMVGSRAAEILGLDDSEVESSFLGYVTSNDNAIRLVETLDHLREEMDSARLPYGRSSAIGLKVQDGQVCLVVEERVGSFIGVSIGVHAFMDLEPETDPRPFYFLPYDPGLNQTKAESDRCKFDLLRRVQQHVVAEVGRVRPPAQLHLTADTLLNRAYFGMYEYWEDRDDRTHLRRLCNRFLHRIARALHSPVPDSMVQDGSLWKVTVNDEDQHDRLIRTLTRFDPTASDLLEHMPQLPETYGNS